MNKKSGNKIDIFSQLDLPVIKQVNSDERTEWVMVTPKVAESILELNYEKQRNVNQARVQAYARDMAEGRWNPQACGAIRISSDRYLIDGQHRLLAVIISGVTVLMKIVYGGGTALETFDYIDNGMARTAAQLIAGKNSSAVAALSRSILCIKRGTTISNALKGASKFKKIEGRITRLTPTRTEIVDYARRHLAELESIAMDEKAVSRSAGGSPMAIGVAMWCIKELHDGHMLDEYVDGFREIAPENRTIAFVQASMIRKVAQARRQRVDVDKEWVFGVFALGYDRFIDGKPINSISAWKRELGLYNANIHAKYSQGKEADDAK